MIYLASDHRGMIRKEEVKKLLDETSEDYQDCGNLILDPEDDEVDFVNNGCERIERDIAASQLRSSPASGGVRVLADPRGIFFCGSGVMVDVAANRFPNIRSCLAFDKKQVEMARNDDDVNVLSIAANFFDLEETTVFVKAFLKTGFSSEGRYLRRIEKLKKS